MLTVKHTKYFQHVDMRIFLNMHVLSVTCKKTHINILPLFLMRCQVRNALNLPSLFAWACESSVCSPLRVRGYDVK